MTCVAATTEADAIETDLSFQAGTVRQVDILIPDGHAGQTGIAIAQAHQVIIPATGPNWIIGNDDRIKWDIADYLDTGEWSAFVYNNGDYPHSWYLRFLVDELPTVVTVPTPAQVPVGDIMLAGTV